MTAELEIYDRDLLRRHRDRAAHMPAAARFLLRQVEEDVIERITFVQRSFARALVIGAADSMLPMWLEAQGMSVERCDSSPVFVAAAGMAGVEMKYIEPDRLFDLAGGYDLVIAPGGLDLVNDLPGLLIQCRRLMTPDAMLIGAMAGAGSLPSLRAALQQAQDAEGRAASPRLHPQIDVRAAGDLLSRAGFVQPVADSFAVELRYRDLSDLLTDVRAHAGGNALIRRDLRPFGKRGYRAMAAALAAGAAPDGRFSEWVELLTITAWTPAKPA